MYQSQQWKDNDDQPGLFTFYVEQQTRELDSIKKGQTRLSHHLEQPLIKKSLRFRKASQRYMTSFSGWKMAKRLEKKESKHLQRANLSQSKNPDIRIRKQKSTDLVSSLKGSYQGKTKKKSSKSQVQLKKRNMNDCFGFDINKCKNRMFIFRGQPARLIKRNYKEVIGNISTIQKIEQRKNQVQKSLNNLKQHVKAINSDIERHPTIKLRYNFVQFLNERRKKQKTDRLKQVSMIRTDLRLSRLLSSDKPNVLCVRSKTQR